VSAKVQRPPCKDERSFAGAVADKGYRHRRARENVGYYRAPIEARKMLRYTVSKLIVKRKPSHERIIPMHADGRASFSVMLELLPGALS
jgi:hypothetical protein